MVRSVTAKRIEEQRQKKGMTQQQIADALNTQRVTIAYYESGERIPKIKDIIALSNLFDVTSDYLLGLNENSSPENQIIGKELGLSDTAVLKLKEYKNNNQQMIDTINSLFKQNGRYFLGYLNNFFHSRDIVAISDIEDNLSYIVTDVGINTFPDVNTLFEQILLDSLVEFAKKMKEDEINATQDE